MSCIRLLLVDYKPNYRSIQNGNMHNLYAIFAKFLGICKQIAAKTTNKLVFFKKLCTFIFRPDAPNLASEQHENKLSHKL